MIQEHEFIAYFEELSINHKSVNHQPETNEAFFYVEDAFDLDEFDQHIRRLTCQMAVMLVADDGQFNDNNSNNHTQELDAQLLFLARKSNDQSIREVRSGCLNTALEYITRMKSDANQGKILNDPRRRVNFRIERIPYKKIGPILDEWYGYELSFTITCPFGWKVSSGTWRDIT
ncbi:hypothetical protein [Pedobacter antarcticus]|uniref:hypothetical protein n=1 Tax=Pedobacter antarcticus TaxID=34086 RepID=UPI00292F4DE8|nr:hypothetical protein [Pedobacter antarcticus]